MPRASGHILEKGDEDLLRLARDTGSAFLATTLAIILTHGGLGFVEPAPVVIVLTKYDRLVKTKKAELEEDGTNLSDEDLREQSEMKAQEALDMCIRSLKVTLRGMYTRGSQTPKPRHVNVLSINFELLILIRVDLSPQTQTNQATKPASRLLFKSLATLSVTSSN